ncbi:MAG: transcription antitermination factor NusB [Chloroflexi bacterium]|nr:transcription antitermination factor NusB [Chloroflexota bacterium]
MASVRRKARTVVLQALYEADIAHHDAQASVARLLEESTLAPEVRRQAQELMAGVVEHGREIDRLLHEAAPLWPLEQMAVVDRALLRLAIFEILFNNRERSAPVGTVINEAVDMAKRFGSENSARFVNGVLGGIAQRAPGATQRETT